MTSPYHLTVKKYLEEQDVRDSLPDHIRRGWNQIYTNEEQNLNEYRCVIAPDGQIPNSIVRQRLATREFQLKETIETFRKVFDLPEHLLKNLSKERPPIRESIEDENYRFTWTDFDEDDREMKRRKSSIQIIVDKQRDKRRKFEDHNYDYDVMEPLNLNEILEEIRTNVGKDLTNEEIKLINELMQIISRHKPDQVTNVYDLFTDVHLIDRIGGVPKLVQAIQEIQKAFEQVTMKTNVASIETVLNLLRDKDQTYLVATELFRSFNDMMQKYRRGKVLKLIDQSADVSDHDQMVFNVLIKDRIQRLAPSDVSTLIDDLDGLLPMQKSRITENRENPTAYLSEHFNLVFTRAHLNGIKTVLKTMGSSISTRLLEFIDRVEFGLQKKLTDQENVLVESVIVDHLNPLNNQELKLVYERFAQQGILKRHTNAGDLQQTISMGLIRKIDKNGLTTVIDNISDAHLDFQPIDALQKVLSSIDQYNHSDASISIEQIQNQLKTAYFIETLNVSNRILYELSKAMDFYSIGHLPLSEDMTADDRATFLEHFQGPFLRLCLQRILQRNSHELNFDLKRVSSDFYQEQIVQMFHELTDGSDELNQNLLLHQLKTHLKKNKELPDKLYRQMVKEKLISPDQPMKIDNDKKKIALIIKESHVILNNDQDRQKQEQFVQLLDKADINVPEKVKTWYKDQAKTPKSPLKSPLKSPVKSPKVVASNADRREEIPAKMKATKMKQAVKAPISVVKSKKIVQRSNEKIISSSKEKTKQIKSMKAQPATKAIDEANNDVSKMVEASESKTSIVSILIHQDSTLKGELIQDSLDQSHIDLPVASSDNTNTTVPVKTSIIPIEEMFQASNEVIRSETTMEGVMETNQTIYLKSMQDTALLLYPDISMASLSQNVTSMIIADRVTNVTDAAFEKVQATQISARTSSTHTRRRTIETISLSPNTSKTNLSTVQTETLSGQISARSSSDISAPVAIPRTSVKSSENIKTTTKTIRRVPSKTAKETETTYMNVLTEALRTLFHRPEYDTAKLRKIHEDLISSGHISPLNEFYRSINDALRVTLDHCLTYEDLIRWTLSLFRSHNKTNLLQFAHHLYDIAIELDLKSVQRLDYTKCSTELQENIKQQLQTLSEYDLREINSYLNATTWENPIYLPKKLHVTLKERMISDLHSFLLHLIQVCHTFEPKYRPFQLRLREIAENFKSRSVSDLVRKLDEIEKFLAQTFAITFIGLSQRMADARFVLVKEK